MKKFVILAIIAVFAVSCNSYQKLLKSTDYDKKYEKAKEYYTKKNFNKAIPLLEQIVPFERGRERGEEVAYLYAMSNYLTEDYILAGYYLRKFATNYPSSPYAEECLFLTSLCYYKDSPKPSLDQANTEQALEEFQFFISKYPNSKYIDTCNILMDKLRYKLKKKSYDNAKLYYDIGYYKSSSIALKNSLADFPDSDYREDILFYSLKSNYLYAINSIDTKKKERLKIALDDYQAYNKQFPTGKYAKEARRIFEDATDKMNSK